MRDIETPVYLLLIGNVNTTIYLAVDLIDLSEGKLFDINSIPRNRIFSAARIWDEYLTVSF